MGQYQPSNQPKETRVNNLHEVSLGFHKKVSAQEARRCPQCAVASCLSGCPLHIDIPGFIRHLREGDAASSLERILQENPFPAICGRICPAPCERMCIFHNDGEAIAIRELERFAADHGQVKGVKKRAAPKGKRVAIIGSGPSGLTAAYYLASQGFGVTIFEANAEPGGLLRYGIPEFRLPQKVLDEQVAVVKNLGVEIQLDVFLGRTLNASEIFMQGYSAIVLALGAGAIDFAQLPGDDADGVYYAEEFLMRSFQGDKEKIIQYALPLFKGKTTLVVGGSAAALDAARLGLRLGQKVHLVFPGLEEQLEAHPQDVKAAIEEGLVIESPMEPVNIDIDDQGRVKGLRCKGLEIIESEEGVNLESSTQEDILMEAQTVILAHGLKPNQFIKSHLPQLRFNDNGTIWTDPQTAQTSVEKIFACGNVVTGAGAVVDAIASGKEMASKLVAIL